MRIKTEWWGLEMLAETEEDGEILKSLFKSLPEKADDCYEEGDILILKAMENYDHAHEERTLFVYKNDEERDCFTYEEIKNSKFAITIFR